MLAKINGLFRLTRDAELRYGTNGNAILKLGLACSEKFKDKETQLFLDATAFSKPAEILNQYAGTKGTQLYLSGKLQTESWQDQSGQNRSKTVMIIEGFDFVSNKQQSQHKPQQQYQAPSQEQMQPPYDDLSESIPF